MLFQPKTDASHLVVSGGAVELDDESGACDNQWMKLTWAPS